MGNKQSKSDPEQKAKEVNEQKSNQMNIQKEKSVNINANNANKVTPNKEIPKQEVELTFMNTQPDIKQVQNIPNPKTYKEYLIKGNYLFKINNWSESYLTYTKSIELNPKKSRSYIDSNYGRIRCLVMMNKIKEAKDGFIKLADEFPKDTSIIINQGLFYIDINEPNNSIELFDRGIELEPGYALIYCYKAMALVKIHCFNEALTCLDKAISYEEFNLGYYVRKAVLLTEMGFKEQSMNIVKIIEVIINENSNKNIYEKAEIEKAMNGVQSIKMFNAVSLFEGSYCATSNGVRNDDQVINDKPETKYSKKRDKDKKEIINHEVSIDKAEEDKEKENEIDIDKERDKVVEKKNNMIKDKENPSNLGKEEEKCIKDDNERKDEEMFHEHYSINNSRKFEEYLTDLPMIKEESQICESYLNEKEIKKIEKLQLNVEIQPNNKDNNVINYDNNVNNNNSHENSIYESVIEIQKDEPKNKEIDSQINKKIEEEEVEVGENNKIEPLTIDKEIQKTKSSNEEEPIMQANKESFLITELKNSETSLITVIKYQTNKATSACKKIYSLPSSMIENKEDIYNKLNAQLQKCDKNNGFPIIYSCNLNNDTNTIEIIEEYCDEGAILSFLKQTDIMFTEKIEIIRILLHSIAFLIINEIPFDYNPKHFLVINTNNSHLIKIIISSIKGLIYPNEIKLITKESLYNLLKEILEIGNQNSNYEKELNELLDTKLNSESNLDLIEIISELIPEFDK